jgi:hypothetical protein
MKSLPHLFRVVLVIAVMVFVALSHFGCEDEATPPASCGKGPFSYDSKTGICRRLSDNQQVEPECCNF